MQRYEDPWPFGAVSREQLGQIVAGAGTFLGERQCPLHARTLTRTDAGQLACSHTRSAELSTFVNMEGDDDMAGLRTKPPLHCVGHVGVNAREGGRTGAGVYGQEKETRCLLLSVVVAASA